MGDADPTERLNTALEGRYRIERELGAGGMATVYLAEDLRHRRKVALKVLKPELAALVGSDRFLAEIQTTANLQHPHILPLFDSGEVDGLPFYVMPYVEGESLRRRMTQDGQIPVSEAVGIAVEVCDALEAAHGQGVVHRDIKPGNILLSGGRPVVADFGIALALSAAGDDRLTGTGVRPGTARYMSPEQASAESVDGRSDVYALGCVLYEMLTGDPPFVASSPAAVLARKVTEEVRPIRTVRPTVPRELEEVVERSLATSPADRYQSAADFARALKSATAQSGPRRGVTVGKPAAGIMLLLAVLALGIWTMNGQRDGGAASAADPGTRTTIAVLPFDNLSGEGPHAYFASALHSELLTQLQRVEALTVIGDRSVRNYVRAGGPMEAIGDELGVGSVVRGSVQVLGDRLRVNVRLSDAVADTLLWAGSYDETLDDAFHVLSRIAQQVVGELGAEITGMEADALARAPTGSAEAYRFYLQGLDYLDRPGVFRQDIEIALRHFEQAVEIDPGYAEAYARLAEAHGRLYVFGLDPSVERAEALRNAAERALSLDPGSPGAHVAMGQWHLWGRRAYRSALERFDLALAALPDDPRIWSLKGYSHRRLGEFDEALKAYEQAVSLDPRDADLIFDLGGVTYWITHRYDQALDAFGRALTFAPDHHAAAVDRGWIYFFRGQSDTLRQVLDGLPADEGLGYHLGTPRRERARLLLYERRVEDLMLLVSDPGPKLMSNQLEFLPSSLHSAWALRLQNDGPAADAAFGAALAALDSALAARPGDWRIRAARGLALAGLGRRDEALREAEAISRSWAFADDGFMRPFLREYRARIYAQAGEIQPAIADLRTLLAGPSFYVTPRTVRVSPLWDPLRGDPGFEALLAEFPVR